MFFVGFFVFFCIASLFAIIVAVDRLVGRTEGYDIFLSKSARRKKNKMIEDDHQKLKAAQEEWLAIHVEGNYEGIPSWFSKYGELYSKYNIPVPFMPEIGRSPRQRSGNHAKRRTSNAGKVSTANTSNASQPAGKPVVAVVKQFPSSF